ncbi:hypothetical protein [Amycolatopsis sp. NPDC021455]|uniref:hypothetical protein n=1 Tax=Amycolatopsis sp. NPDC021455 TaxID=3154901 RepID=UPI0033DB08A8
MVVVAGAGVAVFALLNRGSGYDAVEGKYGAGPLASCDDFAARVGNLPPKRSDTPLGGTQGWLCTFTDEESTVTVHPGRGSDQRGTATHRIRRPDRVGRLRGGPGSAPGERAAWGPIATGRSCELMVLDSNATFKAGLDDGNATQTCKDRVKAIAQALDDVMQPR